MEGQISINQKVTFTPSFLCGGSKILSDSVGVKRSPKFQVVACYLIKRQKIINLDV